MSLLRRLWPTRTGLEPEEQARLGHRSLVGDMQLHSLGQRWIVLDLETTGLNLQRDLVLSIGAVAIEAGSIRLDDQFERTLFHAEHSASESTLIHGIAPSEVANGEKPATALLDFLDYLDGSPLLAFHAAFDRHMLGRALKDSLGYRLTHPFLDVAELAPMLYPDAGLAKAGLDDWIQYLELSIPQRHNACADALATAEMALMLFHRASRKGLSSLGELEAALHTWRTLQNSLAGF